MNISDLSSMAPTRRYPIRLLETETAIMSKYPDICAWLQMRLWIFAKRRRAKYNPCPGSMGKLPVLSEAEGFAYVVEFIFYRYSAWAIRYAL